MCILACIVSSLQTKNNADKKRNKKKKNLLLVTPKDDVNVYDMVCCDP